VFLHVFLFVIAAIGGALNAVAGGGSFLALPALLYAGVPAVAANATTTLAMWPGSVASAFAYRRELSTARRWLLALGPISLIGGLLGGELLVKTSDTRFLTLLPWLMLAAVATFTFSGFLTKRLAAAPLTPPLDSLAPRSLPRVPFWILGLQLVIAIYGGYFGGGMGIMMLAALSIAGMTDIHEMNGIKSVLAAAINGVALGAFIADGVIVWGSELVMVVGGIAGGYFGASMARRFGASAVRRFVITIGWLMTAYFFWRS
jgi:uncharacterized membrane protein YfcA